MNKPNTNTNSTHHNNSNSNSNSVTDMPQHGSVHGAKTRRAATPTGAAHASASRSTPAPAPALEPEARFVGAFDAVRAECAALRPEQLVPITFDVVNAVTIALGALPTLRAMRDEIIALPHADPVRFDKLETYARAAGFTQAVYVSTLDPAPELPALNERAAALREKLFNAAEPLADHNMLDRARLAEIRAGSGYKDMAEDLIALATIFRTLWSALAGRTLLDAKELDEAYALADAMLVGIGLREKAGTQVVEAADHRARAVTLFANAWDEVRRAVMYLRWHQDDADRVAPSIYNRGSAPKRKDGAAEASASTGAATATGRATTDAASTERTPTLTGPSAHGATPR